ncbi:hypothetical protein MTO96_019424 [Rhipicephalus appendiculatus]
MEDSEIAAYAQYCLENLSTANATNRKMPPSTLEINAVRLRENLVCRFYFMDGRTKAIDIHPSITAEDAIKTLATKIGLRSLEGWALYECTPDHEHVIKGFEYLADIIYQWETCRRTSATLTKYTTISKKGPTKALGGGECRFVFRKRLFKAVREIPQDPVEVSLLYAQAVHDVVKADSFPVVERVALQLAGLQAQVSVGEPSEIEELDRYRDVESYIAERIRDTRPENEWIQALCTAHRTYGSGKSELVCKVWYLSIVMQYPLYGTALFPVTCRGYLTYDHQLLLGVSCEGVLLVNADSKAILNAYRYSDLESVLVNEEDRLVTVTLSKSVPDLHKCYLFETPQHQEVASLVASYWPPLAARMKPSYELSVKGRLAFEDRVKLHQEVMNCRRTLVDSGLLNKPEVATLGLFRSTLRRLNRNRLDKLRQEYSSEGYKSYQHTYWAFGKTPIPQSFLVMADPQAETTATKVYTSILIFSGLLEEEDTEWHGQRDLIQLAQSIIECCMVREVLLNELFMQLIKQTTDHPDPNSRVNVRHWQLLSLLCSVAAPTDRRILGYLHAHLRHCAMDVVTEEGQFAQFALKCLMRTLETRGRRWPPSRDEVSCTTRRHPCRSKVHFLDGQVQNVDFDPCVSAAEMLTMLKARINLRPTAEGYAIYEVIGPTERAMLPDEKMADAMSKWERWAQSQQGTAKANKQQYFLFKKHLMLDAYIDLSDPVEEELLFHQLVYNIRLDRFPVTEHEAVTLCALKAQLDYGDFREAIVDYRKVMAQCLPMRLLKMISADQVVTQHQALAGMNVQESKRAFLALLQSWPLHRATIFEVTQSYTSSWPKTLWFAVDQTGVHLLELRTRNVLCACEYESIVNYSPSLNSLMIVTGGGKKGAKYIFTTNQALQIAGLIKDYTNVLQIKRKPIERMWHTPYVDASAAATQEGQGGIQQEPATPQGSGVAAAATARGFSASQHPLQTSSAASSRRGFCLGNFRWAHKQGDRGVDLCVVLNRGESAQISNEFWLVTIPKSGEDAYLNVVEQAFQEASAGGEYDDQVVAYAPEVDGVALQPHGDEEDLADGILRQEVGEDAQIADKAALAAAVDGDAAAGAHDPATVNSSAGSDVSPVLAAQDLAADAVEGAGGAAPVEAAENGELLPENGGGGVEGFSNRRRRWGPCRTNSYPVEDDAASVAPSAVDDDEESVDAGGPVTIQPAVATATSQQKQSTAPLGSSENPIQIIQQGNTYHSTQVLSPEQLQQIAHVLQQQQVNRAIQNGGSAVVFNPQTNTRIIYRVIYPRVVEEDDPRSDGPELSREEKEEKKKHRPRTRSGRISKPPSYMVKDYKRIHHLDFDDEPYDDSDGGYSDYQVSDDEDRNRRSTGYGGRPRNFKCPTCSKSYIGRGGLCRHLRLYPDHGNPSDVDEMVAQGESTTTTDTPPTSGTNNPAMYMAAPQRGRYADLASMRRKARLKEVTKACREEELMEVVLPRLSESVSLWEFLLTKCEKGDPPQLQIPEMLIQLEEVLREMRALSQESLVPVEPGEEAAHVGSQLMKIEDESVAQAMGITTGLYAIREEEVVAKVAPVARKRPRVESESSQSQPASTTEASGVATSTGAGGVEFVTPEEMVAALHGEPLPPNKRIRLDDEDAFVVLTGSGVDSEAAKVDGIIEATLNSDSLSENMLENLEFAGLPVTDDAVTNGNDEDAQPATPVPVTAVTATAAATPVTTAVTATLGGHAETFQFIQQAGKSQLHKVQILPGQSLLNRNFVRVVTSSESSPPPPAAEVSPAAAAPVTIAKPESATPPEATEAADAILPAEPEEEPQATAISQKQADVQVVESHGNDDSQHEITQVVCADDGEAVNGTVAAAQPVIRQYMLPDGQIVSAYEDAEGSLVQLETPEEEQTTALGNVVIVQNPDGTTTLQVPSDGSIPHRNGPGAAGHGPVGYGGAHARRRHRNSLSRLGIGFDA